MCLLNTLIVTLYSHRSYTVCCHMQVWSYLTILVQIVNCQLLCAAFDRYIGRSWKLKNLLLLVLSRPMYRELVRTSSRSAFVHCSLTWVNSRVSSLGTLDLDFVNKFVKK
ncbi:hypothetical protein V1522DRAFT_228836 [Lipomyces starkeyi]